MAADRSGTAVTAALVPFCVARAEDPAAAVGLAKFRAETSSYARSDLVGTAGWATMPGMPGPNSALASACSEKLMTAAK